MCWKRLDLSVRDDGFTISTVKSYDKRYGNYETAIRYYDLNWKVVEGYETEEEAKEGHIKYDNMSTEKLNRL